MYPRLNPGLPVAEGPALPHENIQRTHVGIQSDVSPNSVCAFFPPGRCRWLSRSLLPSPGCRERYIANLRHLPVRLRDRKSVVEGKSVSVRVDLGGRRVLKKTKITR